MKRFLTAQWRDLVMANYEVPPEVLESRVPKGTLLDLHEGKCFASLVSFMFLDSKVMGFKVPFHIDFEEVNLRFYVRRETGDEIRRGVVFVKEIVPRAAITFVARTLYGEPYETWKMSHGRDGDRLSYSWSKGGVSNSVDVTIGENGGVPDEGSHGEFIIEHYWGYTDRGGARTDEYKVEHPKWELFQIPKFDIDVDFGSVYGSEFEFLREEEPFSVIMAKGSEISVFKGAKLSFSD